MQTEAYAELEARMNGLAVAAAGGDAPAAERLAEELAALAKAPRSDGWPRPGSVAYAVFDAFLKVDERDVAILRRLLDPFLAAIEAHPETLGVPYRLEPARMLGPSAIPRLALLLGRGLSLTSRAAIEGLDYGNPLNEPGFRLANDAVTRLFEYEEAVDEVVQAWLSLPWDDERLWLLFRLLASGPVPMDEVARAVLPRLVAATATIAGPGADKLRALLLRKKVIPKTLAPGVKPATLPRKLPLTVAEALALLETWELPAAEVQASGPAKPRELEALANKVGRLPRELTRLLSAHASLGSRELGPPARMRQLVRELAGTIEEDEEDSDEAPHGHGRFDVRGFNPTKKGIPLGTDPSGDLYFLATGAKSGAEMAPVIRFRHDQALVATIAADSLGEYVALTIARVYARREGLEPELDRLESRKRTIVSGYVRPKVARED